MSHNKFYAPELALHPFQCSYISSSIRELPVIHGHMSEIFIDKGSENHIAKKDVKLSTSEGSESNMFISGSFKGKMASKVHCVLEMYHNGISSMCSIIIQEKHVIRMVRKFIISLLFQTHNIA